MILFFRPWPGPQHSSGSGRRSQDPSAAPGHKGQSRTPGLPDVIHILKPKTLGKFWPWNGKGLLYVFFCHLEYITTIWYILWPFGFLAAIWYPRFGILCHEKSGNPVEHKE
jgi:hypothetical protein